MGIQEDIQKQTDSYYASLPSEPLVLGNSSNTTYEDRKNKLALRLQEKKDKLGLTNLANTTGYDESVSPQQNLSNAVDSQIYTRDNGSKYQLDYMLGSDGISQGTREVEYTDRNKYGTLDTRDLYIDDTAQGNMKLGLARTDQGGFDGRYDKNLHPDWKTAGNNELAGADGVTPDDGALMNITLPYNQATEFEYGVHTNPEQIRNRVIGLGSKTNETQRRFGSGQTEYTTRNAPMWNQDYISNNKDISNAEPVGDMKLHETAASSGGMTEEEAMTALNGGSDTEDSAGFFNSLARAPKAAIAGITRGIYDVADTTVEVAGRGASELVGLIDKESGKKLDKYADLATDEEKKKQINSAIGYDSSFNDQTMKESGDLYDKAVKDVDLFNPSTWDNIDVGYLAKSAMKAFSTPEAAAYSLGYIAPAMVGVAEKATVKLFGGALKSHAKNVEKIVKNKTKTSAAKKAEVRILEQAMKPADKVKLFIAKNSDAALYGATMNNDQMDEWIENSGGEAPSMMKIGTGWALNTIGMKMDIGSAKFAINTKKDFVDTIAAKFVMTDKNMAAKAVAKAMEYTARMAAAGMTEMPQEFSQSFIEAFNKVHGTTKMTAEEFLTGVQSEDPERVEFLEALMSEEVRTEAAKGSIGGLAGGVHMSMGGQSIRLANDLAGSDSAKKAADAVKSFAEPISKINKEKEDQAKAEEDDYEASSDPKFTSTIKPVYKEDVEKMATEDLSRTIENEIDSFDTSDKLDSIDQLIKANNLDEYITSKMTREDYSSDEVFERKANSFFEKADAKRDDVLTGIAEEYKEAELLGKKGNKKDIEAFNAMNEKFKTLSKVDKEDTLAKYSALQIQEMPQEEQEKAIQDIKDEIQFEDPLFSGSEIDNTTSEKPAQVKATTQTVVEKQIEAKAKPIEDKVDTPTSQTEEYTQGISGRTIEKLAERFGIKNVDVQATLNSALGAIQIMKMKEVGKGADEFQYNLYHGKDGIIPQYAKYRSAIKSANTKEAVEAIGKIQQHGYSQEKKFNRFATKYMEVQDAINKIVDSSDRMLEIKKKTNKKVTKEKIIANGIKALNGKEFRAQYSDHKIYAKQVAADMNLPDGVLKELGIDGTTESSTSVLMRSMAESIDHIDGILAAAGHTRKQDKGRTVTSADDAARFKSTSDSLAKEIDILESELKNPDITQNVADAINLDIGVLKKSAENNEAGLSRLSGSDKLGSQKRWVSESNKEDIDALKAELDGMAKNPRTDENKARKAEIEKILAEFSSDKKTLAQVEANLGKDVGKESEGKTIAAKRGYKSRRAYSQILGRSKKAEAPASVKKVTEEVVETKDEKTFVTTSDQVKIPALVKELAEKRTEIKKVNAEIENKVKAIEDSKDLATEKLREELGLNAKKYFKAVDAIYTAQNIIEKSSKELKKLETKKKKIETSVQKSIRLKAERLSEVSGKIGEELEVEIEKTTKQINSRLEFVKDHMSDEEISGNKKEIKDVSDMLLAVGSKFTRLVKGLHNILYRYIQKDELSELTKKIRALEGKISKAESTIYKESKVVDEVNKIDPGIANKYKIIRKLKDDLRETKVERTYRIALIRKRIDEILPKLKGTTLLDDWVKNSSAFKDGKGKSRKPIASINGPESQELDISKISEFKGTVLGAIPANQMQELMNNELAHEFTEEFNLAKEALNKHLNFTSNKDRDTMSHFQLQNSPMSGLLFGKKASDSMNEQMVVAIMIAGSNWAGSNGSSNLFNDVQDIVAMRDYSSEAQVTSGDKKVLSKAGSYRKVVAYGLGRQVAQLIGFKPAEGMTEGMENKIYSDLGMMTIAYMQGRGLVKPMQETRILREDWNKYIDKDGYQDNGEGFIPMIESIDSDKAKADYIKLGKFVRNVEDALNIDTLDKNYLTSSPAKPEVRVVRGSIWDVPKESSDTLDVIEQEEFRLVENSIDMIEKIYGDRDGYLKAAGWKDTDEMIERNKPEHDESMHTLYDEIDAQKGKNRDIENSIDQLYELDKKIKDGEITGSLYFKWFFSKNGRFMLDSIGINPQTDKLLHRWLVAPKSSENKWNTGNKEFYYFKQGVAQAFGFGIDKSRTSDIKAVGSALIEMNEAELIKLVQAGEFEVAGIKLEVEHPGHVIQAIEAIGKYREAKKKAGSKDFSFNATMTSEYDSVTSGFANKLLQAPILGEALARWMAKTGIFKAGASKSEMSMNDYIAEGTNPDAYRTLVVEVNNNPKELLKVRDRKGNIDKEQSELMKNMIDGWIDKDGKSLPVQAMQDESGEVTSWARNLFKYPFMIFNYAASIGSIRKNLANDMTENILDGIMKGRYSLDNEAGKAFLNGIGVNSNAKLYSLKEDLRTKPLEDVKVSGQKLNVNDTIANLFNNTYGRIVEKVMKKEFGPLVEVNTAIVASTQLMFQSFIARLTKETLAKEDELGRGLSKDEVTDIIKGTVGEDGKRTGGLEAEFPLIKAPNSEGRADGIAIINSGLMSTKDTKLDSGALHVKNMGGVKTQSVQMMIREYKVAQASGAVLPIHWIDGTIIGKTLKRAGILGVHDAIVVGKDFEKSIQSMNKATYDTGSNYNLTAEVLSALVQSIESLEKHDMLDSLESIEVEKGQDYWTPDTIVAKMKTIAEEAQVGRDKLFSNGLTIRNIADVKKSGYTSGSDISSTALNINDVKSNAIIKKLIEQNYDAQKGENTTAEKHAEQFRTTDGVVANTTEMDELKIEWEDDLKALSSKINDTIEPVIDMTDGEKIGLLIDSTAPLGYFDGRGAHVTTAIELAKMKNSILKSDSELEMIIEDYVLAMKDMFNKKNNLTEYEQERLSNLDNITIDNVNNKSIQVRYENAVEQMKTSGTAIHELGHGVTLRFLLTKKEHELSKDIEQIFEAAKAYARTSMKKGVVNNLVDEKYAHFVARDKPYWTTSSTEFIAEMMRSPEMMAELTKVKGLKSISDKGSLAQQLIETFVKIVELVTGKKLDNKSLAGNLINTLDKIVSIQVNSRGSELSAKNDKIIQEYEKANQVQNSIAGVNFDKKLDAKLKKILKKLYPGVRLEYTDKEILHSNGVILQKENVKHNVSETADVAALMRELGYDTEGAVESDVTNNQILDAQIKVLSELSKGTTGRLDEILNWIDTSKHSDEANRGQRGRKHAIKYGNGNSKYTGESGQVSPTKIEQDKHLHMQVAEELLEIVVENGNISAEVNRMLEQQKRAFKSIRFLGSTINKDSGKTNNQQLADELNGTKYAKIPLKTDSDKFNLIIQLAADIKKKIGASVAIAQKDTAGRIKGQANIEAKTVLINSLLQSQDTLPHEYAHHYIAMFRDSPIVQEGIKKWGSEEKLVQAIGEQVVVQKGEAYGWWEEFTKWIQELFNKLPSKSKEEIRDLLTDSFLENKDLSEDSDIIVEPKISKDISQDTIDKANEMLKNACKQ